MAKESSNWATCDIYQQEPETTSHMLWTFRFARNVWALIRGWVQKCSNEVDDFFLLFKKMQTALEVDDLDRWAVTAWSIWNARNKYYFDHGQLQPRVIMERANSVLTEYKTCMAAQQIDSWYRRTLVPFPSGWW